MCAPWHCLHSWRTDDAVDHDVVGDSHDDGEVDDDEVDDDEGDHNDDDDEGDGDDVDDDECEC